MMDPSIHLMCVALGCTVSQIVNHEIEELTGTTKSVRLSFMDLIRGSNPFSCIIK